MLDCTTSVIRNITSYYHITAEKRTQKKNVRMVLYSYESFKLIKEYHEARRNKEKRRMIKESPAMTEEEVAALEDHSLVIDKRCLDFNYWPDTVPACFQECEE
jgi:t-SNARE complex subunit (syntaxin)